jgi:hypothetical protein
MRTDMPRAFASSTDSTLRPSVSVPNSLRRASAAVATEDPKLFNTSTPTNHAHLIRREPERPHADEIETHCSFVTQTLAEDLGPPV